MGLDSHHACDFILEHGREVLRMTQQRLACGLDSYDTVGDGEFGRGHAKLSLQNRGRATSNKFVTVGWLRRSRERQTKRHEAKEKTSHNLSEV